MIDPPATGVITFLFTDIEGSTQLWENQPEAMRLALEKHDALMRAVLQAHNGYIFKTGGDGFYAAFASPLDGLQAAVEAQRALHRESWGATPIRVRMGLHSGEAESRDGDYFGQTLNRVARLMAAGHGGQVLLSNATQALVHTRLPPGISLKDLGERRLKDLTDPERIFQSQAQGLPDVFSPLRTLDSFRHNLPQQRTSFIGRQEVLARARRLLEEHRLLTLAGPGGIGKTRLSLQVAAESLEQFEDGTWFVELAPVFEAGLVVKTVLNTLGLREEAARPAQQVLTDFLGAKRSLLILDNCEHLVEASARLTDDLMRACLDLKIMASSREGFGIPGEAVFQVPVLSIPAPGRSVRVEDLSASEAVELFVERARAILPDFQITPANAPAVLQVCRRLDGIPLAIELAAARVNLLQVEQIAARLDDAFSLLKSSQRQALPHQQTLRATIDWSYNLLSAQERIMLNRLSVFVSGWTLEAAEQVCSGEGIGSHEILDLLDLLSGKSLVRIERIQGQETRYSLLETVRLYAQEKLALAGELESWQGRHLAYFQALSESAEQGIYSREQRGWLETLERELDNLNAALQRCTESKNDLEKGMALAANLGWFWYARGYLREGLEWLQRLVDEPEYRGPDLIRARVLRSGALLKLVSGQLEEAMDWSDRGLEIFQREHYPRGIAESWTLQGIIMVFQSYADSEPAAALSLVRNGLALAHEIGHQWIIGEAEHILGHIFIDLEDHSQAAVHFERSIEHFREVGNQVSLVHPLNDLGRVTRGQGDLETASRLFDESLAASKQIGHHWGTSLSLYDLGWVAYLKADYRQSMRYLSESLSQALDIGARSTISQSLVLFGYAWALSGGGEKWIQLLGAAEALSEAMGRTLTLDEDEDYQQVLEATAQDPSSELFISNWQTGRRLTIQQALELVEERRPQRTP